jgi:hypothetical protein
MIVANDCLILHIFHMAERETYQRARGKQSDVVKEIVLSTPVGVLSTIYNIGIHFCAMLSIFHTPLSVTRVLFLFCWGTKLLLTVKVRVAVPVVPLVVTLPN